MGRLEELYGGELYPDEKITGHGPEYEEIRENLDKIWEELKRLLTEEGYALVEKLDEETRRMEALRNREGFIYGFRLAVQLLLEGLQALGWAPVFVLSMPLQRAFDVSRRARPVLYKVQTRYGTGGKRTVDFSKSVLKRTLFFQKKEVRKCFF